MTERQGVEIDFCPKCRGVWLDRGELDKLLAREAELSGRRHAGGDDYRRRDDDDDDDDDDRYRRRPSFWREFFD
jgi:hypothetical protein